jgi:hypothetical protein
MNGVLTVSDRTISVPDEQRFLECRHSPSGRNRSQGSDPAIESRKSPI